MINRVIQGDCREEMKRIPDKSVDMILCDLPYGTTACSWDTIIPFEPLWEAYKRIIKDNGAIVLTASQPFTSKLVMSNIEMFRYEWIWDKGNPTNFASAAKMPLKYHENILVFYKKQPIYNPQKFAGTVNHSHGKAVAGSRSTMGGKEVKRAASDQSGLKYPRSIIELSKHSSQCGDHPTQKSVALFEYFIKTYTNEGDTVLDNCAGSFTTAIAAIKTNRNWICIEKEEEYCEVGMERIKEELSQGDMFRTVKYD